MFYFSSTQFKLMHVSLELVRQIGLIFMCKGRTFGLLLLTILVAKFTNLCLNYFSTRVLSQPCAFLTINFVKKNNYMIYVIIDVTYL